jgi:hypothetical protein
MFSSSEDFSDEIKLGNPVLTWFARKHFFAKHLLVECLSSPPSTTFIVYAAFPPFNLTFL